MVFGSMNPFQARSDSYFPVSTGDNTTNYLLPALGPMPAKQGYNPESQLSQESFGLAKMYEGKSRFLEKSLETNLMRTPNAWATELLPLEYADDLTYRWTKWNFHRTVAPQTASQAPPEYVQSSREEHSGHMQRNALATIIGAEELKTPEGQFLLYGNMVNMAMSIGQSIEQNIITAFLTEKNYYRDLARKKGQKYRSIEDLLEVEKQRWDIIRKHPSGKGAYVLDEQVRKTMRNVTPTDIVVPEGTRSIIAMSPAEIEYYRAGPEARTNLKQGGNAIQSLRDSRIHVVQKFDLDFNGVESSPLERDRIIGDHFRLDDFFTDCTDDDYCSLVRNTDVFDMSLNDFHEVSLKTALRHCERFEDDSRGDLKQWHHQLAKDLAKKAKKYGLRYNADDLVDMFLYRAVDSSGQTVYKVVERIGDQEHKALSYEQVRLVGRSVAARVRKIMSSEEEQAINQGINVIDRIYNQTVDTDILSDSIAAVNTGELSGLGTIPAGFGSARGLFEIARIANSGDDTQIDAGIRQAAVKFTSAVTKLHGIMQSMFVHSHPALDPTNVPSAFQSSAQGRAKEAEDSLITFAQNLVDSNKLGVFTPVGVGEAGVSATFPDVGENDIKFGIVESLKDFAVPQRVADVFRDEFAANYESSAFAAAYASAMRGKGRKSVDDVASLKTFDAFLTREVSPYLSNQEGLIQLLNWVADSVAKGDAPSNIKSEIKAYRSSRPTVGAAASADGKVTYLTVAPSQVPVGFAVQSPNNPNLPQSSIQIKNIADKDSRADPASSTLFSRARPGSNGGSRRSGARASGPADPVPSYYGSEFVSAVGDSLQANRALTERYSRANSEERDVLVRIGMQMVLLAPVCRATYEKLIDSDVRCPIAALGERPFRRYRTGSFIYVRRGPRLGNTFYSHNDVHIAANAINKTLMIHFSFWHAAVIKNADEYHIAEDVVVTGYGGGEDLTPFTTENFSAMHQATQQNGSVFYFLVPYGSLRGENPVPKTHDIRGRYDEDLWRNRLAPVAARNMDRPHYASALYYNMVYKFDNLETMAAEDMDEFKPEGRNDNTVTHQTAQWLYNPITRQKTLIPNTGHFEQHVYQGVGKYRRGYEAPYGSSKENQNYQPIS